MVMGRKSRGIKRTTWLEMIFIFALMLGLPLVYLLSKSPAQPSPEPTSKADLEVSGRFFLARLERDRLQLQARARDYAFFRDKGRAEFFSPEIQLYTSSGPVQISSRKAEYQVSPELLVFSGGVELEFSHYQIKSEQLTYEPENNLLRIPGDLRVVGAGMELTGADAWFDLNRSRLGIDSQVQGRFEREE